MKQLKQRVGLDTIQTIQDLMYQDDFKEKTTTKRDSTTKYEIIKYLSKNINKKFTEEDKKEYEKIWGKKRNKCIVTNNTIKGAGDHAYGVRENYKETGEYGVNDEWNKIYVKHKAQTTGGNCYKEVWYENKNKEKIMKNIFVDTFTEDDLKEIEEYYKDEKRNIFEIDEIKHKFNWYEIVQKAIKWKKYVSERGAKLSFSLPKEADDLLDEIGKNIDDQMNFWAKNLLKKYILHQDSSKSSVKSSVKSSSKSKSSKNRKKSIPITPNVD